MIYAISFLKASDIILIFSPQIAGYNRLTTLQVFIGSDQGRVTPHMFYQACRVTGKNSTPCSEKNINGTIVIEIDIDPSKDMTVT